jgi:hypothetical protein
LMGWSNCRSGGIVHKFNVGYAPLVAELDRKSVV